MNVLNFQSKKQNNEKITMVTCYDYWTAQIISATDVDCLLVGDSLAMVIYGEESTLNVSIEQMSQHVQAVKKGAPKKFIVGDLPFMSYRKSLETTMNNVESLMKAGASSIKLEGAQGNLKSIQHIVESGVPVMGHLGLTPQMVHQMGGYKVQGQSKKQAQQIIDWSKQLEDSGCYSIVLECVPTSLAEEITRSVSIPTIGIGAGPVTDGQVLVTQDLLGAFNKNPKFVRKYADVSSLITNALQKFNNDVVCGTYPNKNESYQ